MLQTAKMSLCFKCLLHIWECEPHLCVQVDGRALTPHCISQYWRVVTRWSRRADLCLQRSFSLQLPLVAKSSSGLHYSAPNTLQVLFIQPSIRSSMRGCWMLDASRTGRRLLVIRSRTFVRIWRESSMVDNTSIATKSALVSAPTLSVAVLLDSWFAFVCCFFVCFALCCGLCGYFNCVLPTFIKLSSLVGWSIWQFICFILGCTSGSTLASVRNGANW